MLLPSIFHDWKSKLYLINFNDARNNRISPACNRGGSNAVAGAVLLGRVSFVSIWKQPQGKWSQSRWAFGESRAWFSDAPWSLFCDKWRENIARGSGVGFFLPVNLCIVFEFALGTLVFTSTAAFWLVWNLGISSNSDYSATKQHHSTPEEIHCDKRCVTEKLLRQCSVFCRFVSERYETHSLTLIDLPRKKRACCFATYSAQSCLVYFAAEEGFANNVKRNRFENFSRLGICGVWRIFGKVVSEEIASCLWRRNQKLSRVFFLQFRGIQNDSLEWGKSCARCTFIPSMSIVKYQKSNEVDFMKCLCNKIRTSTTSLTQQLSVSLINLF